MQKVSSEMIRRIGQAQLLWLFDRGREGPPSIWNHYEKKQLETNYFVTCLNKERTNIWSTIRSVMTTRRTITATNDIDVTMTMIPLLVSIFDNDSRDDSCHCRRLSRRTARDSSYSIALQLQRIHILLILVSLIGIKFG